MTALANGRRGEIGVGPSGVLVQIGGVRLFQALDEQPLSGNQVARRDLHGAQVVERVHAHLLSALPLGQPLKQGERALPPDTCPGQVTRQHPQLGAVAVGHRELDRPAPLEQVDGHRGLLLGFLVATREPAEP